MKKILVLGTGNAQKDIIQYCKGNGFYVIASSYASGGSAQELADEFYQVDITDVQATEALAKEKQVNFVYSVGSDVAMPTIAKVSEDLDIPCFIKYETAVVCNHKNMLREILERNNVEGNVPFQTIESVDEEIHVPFPAIMKPSDSQGQRGVRKVENVDEVKKYFSDTVSFSREKKVIIEQFIEGTEISVNVFLEEGELKFYLISDREVWNEYPGGIIKEHIIPSRYETNKAIAERIKKLVVNVLSAIGLKNGPAYFQIKISQEGYPYLIEVTPRLDGCHMWRVIKYSTGVDLLKASMDMLVGDTYKQQAEYNIIPYSLEFLCDKPGTVFSKENYQIPNNVHMCLYYDEGQTINRMNGYCEKCGYIIKKGKL